MVPNEKTDYENTQARSLLCDITAITQLTSLCKTAMHFLYWVQRPPFTDGAIFETFWVLSVGFLPEGLY